MIGLGDTVSQFAIEGRTSWDHWRTARFAGIAFCMITPSTRVWVDIVLPRLVPIKAGQPATTTQALKKVACDLGFFGPMINSVFVGANMYFSGEVDGYDKMLAKM